MRPDSLVRGSAADQGSGADCESNSPYRKEAGRRGAVVDEPRALDRD